MPNCWAYSKSNCRKNIVSFENWFKGSHLRHRHGHIGRTKQQAAAPSAEQFGLGPERLLFVSKLVKKTREAEILVE